MFQSRKIVEKMQKRLWQGSGKEASCYAWQITSVDQRGGSEKVYRIHPLAGAQLLCICIRKSHCVHTNHPPRHAIRHWWQNWEIYHPIHLHYSAISHHPWHPCGTFLQVVGHHRTCGPFDDIGGFHNASANQPQRDNWGCRRWAQSDRNLHSLLRAGYCDSIHRSHIFSPPCDSHDTFLHMDWLCSSPPLFKGRCHERRLGHHDCCGSYHAARNLSVHVLQGQGGTFHQNQERRAASILALRFARCCPR